MKIKFINILFRQRKGLLLFSMRVFIFLLCTSTFGFTTGEIFSQSTKIHIDKDQMVSIDDVFDLLREQTEYTFIYQEDLFKNLPKVQLKKGFIRANRLLETCFAGKDFKLDLKGNKIVIIATGPSFKKQQTLTISGTVLDMDGQPLPGANILEKGTTNGTQADFDGNFSISVDNDSAILVVSYIGFATNEVAITEQSNIKIVLKESAAGLEEVVVVGYGTQSRETVTSSISKVNTKDINNLVYANVTQALQGKVPGLTVINTSGQPGSGPQIVLRGGSSISGGSSPLYIVDGVERGEINGLRSDNIKTIQVLKDATSTAIYGARGSNGVIIITTKTGDVGKSSIIFRSRSGFSAFRNEKFRPIGGEDYIRTARIGQLNSILLGNSVINSFGGDARAASLSSLDNADSYGTGNNLSSNTLYTTMLLNDDNRYLLSQGWSKMADPVTGRDILFKDMDWYDINYSVGIRQENNLSFSGADEKGSFYLNAGLLNDKGVLVNTQYDLFTAVLNSDRKITDHFKVFGKFDISHEMKDQPSGFSSSNYSSGVHLRNAILRSPNIAPSTKYTFGDGSLAPGVNQLMANPDYVNEHLIRDQRKTRWTALLGFNWDITPELNFSPKGSIYHVETLENSSNDAYLNGTTLNSDRIKRTVTAINWIKQFDGVLSYNKTFNEKHNIAATALASYRSLDYFYSNAASQGSPTDVIKTLNGGAEAFQVPTSTTTKDVLIGFASRLIYDYDKRYLFQASVRRDGSSRFGDDNKWGVFKGVSAGWNIHNEGFFNSSFFSNILNTLKIRASFGETGNNNNLGLYTFQGGYGAGVYGGQGVVYKTGLANSGLKWETTRTFDAGLDIGLFDNRITLLADYYKRETTDLLQSLSLPANTGYSSITTNFAELGNKGVELGVNVHIINGQNFNWEFGANYSYNKTAVLKLPDNGVENNRIGGIEVVDPNNTDNTIWVGGYQEGQELGLIYAYKHDGIYENWQEVVDDGIIDTRANGGAGRFVMGTDYQVIDTNGDNVVTIADRVNKGGGDVRWADLNGDKVINSLDRIYIGRSRAPHYGGVINTFTYKNFNLRLNMDYALGHMVYDYETRYRNGRYTANIAMMPSMNNMWTPTNTKTSIAQYYQGDPMGNWNRGSSDMYYKGDYLCIRDVTLNYTMPKKWLNKTPITGVEIYGTGQNLYYFTAYPGYQPEKGGTSDQNSFQYPLPRTFTLGVNLTF
ncbi:SusC/RagA family TonB-linked outer membrane protein [Arenibacter aquaticus]|nr:TonB-dependent receptor [Arenibacter aquaticus]